MRIFGQGMSTWSSTLLIVAVLGAAVGHVGPAGAQPLQTFKKEPEPNQLACGQKVLVENQTCPAGQILEVTGSCLDEKVVPGTLRRGRQLNCIQLKK